MSLLQPLPPIDPSALSSLGNALESSTQPAPQSEPSTTDKLFSGFMTLLQGIPGGAGLAGIGSSGVTASQTLQAAKASITWPRVAAFVVGIIAIGGGILMFRQTQVVIQSGARAAKRVGEIAAL